MRDNKQVNNLLECQVDVQIQLTWLDLSLTVGKNDM